jgi:catechol 2,3-dioxygenase-like lactoylglutathione lyase family enzyme
LQEISMDPVIQLRICIDVPDLDAGISFYCSALGLTAGRRLGVDWVELLGGPAPLDLLRAPTGSQPALGLESPRHYGRHWTPVHLDLVVTELDGSLQRAIGAGARLERPVQERRWGRLANLADPFGHGLCLLEFKGRGYGELLGPLPPADGNPEGAGS